MSPWYNEPIQKVGQFVSPGNLEVGLAEVDITPPVNTRMAGHFYEVLSDGAHDPLQAKAVVLKQGDVEIALAFCDVVSISPRVSTKARQRFSENTGVPFANTMISATHSHTGPLYDDPRRDYFHERSIREIGNDPHEPDEDYTDILTERLIACLGRAHGALEPAVLSSTHTQQDGISFNRRYHMRDGSVRFNPGQRNPDIVRPAGPIDPRVDSLLFHSKASAAALGGLTVFANHCDTAGGTEFSADYPYFISQALRAVYGDQFISAFGLGACGDINHIDTAKDGPRKGITITERVGKSIGSAIVHSQLGEVGASQVKLAAERTTLDIPLQQPTHISSDIALGKLPLLDQKDKNFMEIVEALKTLDLAARGENWPVEIQAFRLTDDTAILGLPGEIFVELGLDIKQRSPFKNTIIITLTNDRLSYVPTLKAFQEGSYEVTNSRVQPGGGEKLVEASLNTLARLITQ